MTTTGPLGGEEPPFPTQLKALANDASIEIIKTLVQHKPTPVPVSVLAQELGIRRSTASMRLARLRKVHMVAMEEESRRKGWTVNTGEVKAVIGLENYKTRITQDLHIPNEDTPGQS